MEFKSAYYVSFNNAIAKYGLKPESIPFAAEGFQGPEEMFYGWSIYLIG